MISEEQMNMFWKFLEFYPDEDEPGFDGIHYGGIKGIAPDAPKTAREAFNEYQKAISEGIKLFV